MNIFSKLNSIFLVVLIFLSGCIIQSSQLNGLIELIKSPSMDLSENSWSVRFSDYESIVYAVSTAEGILFSNEKGDHVLFDGWTVRKVRGMGSRRFKINISDAVNIRTFKMGNRIVSTHNCDQWEQQENFGVVRYLQYCSDRKSYKNSILVQESGNISVIRQIVDERYTPLILTKLK